MPSPSPAPGWEIFSMLQFLTGHAIIIAMAAIIVGNIIAIIAILFAQRASDLAFDAIELAFTDQNLQSQSSLPEENQSEICGKDSIHPDLHRASDIMMQVLLKASRCQRS